MPGARGCDPRGGCGGWVQRQGGLCASAGGGVQGEGAGLRGCRSEWEVAGDEPGERRVRALPAEGHVTHREFKQEA